MRDKTLTANDRGVNLGPEKFHEDKSYRDLIIVAINKVLLEEHGVSLQDFDWEETSDFALLV